MAEGEEPPISIGVEVVNVSLSPLQDLWYCSSPLFFAAPTDISPPNALLQWNISGEAPNLDESPNLCVNTRACLDPQIKITARLILL